MAGRSPTMGLAEYAISFWETAHVIYLLQAKDVLQYSKPIFCASECYFALCFGEMIERDSIGLV